MSAFPDGEVANPPLQESGEGLDTLEGAPIGPRDFVLAPEAGPLETDYHVGRLTLSESGLAAGVIAIAILDGKLLIALPEAVWSRTPNRRLIPSRSLGKPVLIAVAASHYEERDQPLSGVYCKVWVGFASRELEQELDFVSEEVLSYDFNPEGEMDLLPSAGGLVEVAREHFSFVTADSAVPECPPESPRRQEDRLQSLEASLEQIQQSLSVLMGHLQPEKKDSTADRVRSLTATPKVSASVKKSKRGSLDHAEVPGLDREAVQAALAAGVPLKHLQEVWRCFEWKAQAPGRTPSEEAHKAKSQWPLERKRGGERRAGARPRARRRWFSSWRREWQADGTGCAPPCIHSKTPCSSEGEEGPHRKHCWTEEVV